jgi:Protein of unknown function (Hypoth_ymh)
MTQLDISWALEQLRSFLRVTDQVGYNNSPGEVLVMGTHMRGSETEAAGLAHVVEQILDRVISDWPRHAPSDQPKRRPWNHLRDWAGRAIAQLERQEELREKLGDNAPLLDAGRLHPWVWDGAASLWRTKHYRQAVDRAAVHLNAETQNKVGRRNVSETKLFQQVFSTDAPLPGKSRLRLMDDDGSDTFKNVHRGAMAMAEGLYAAIRNPIAHEVGIEMEEQEALEQLAAFSVLARWVDQAAVLMAK